MNRFNSGRMWSHRKNQMGKQYRQTVDLIKRRQRLKRLQASFIIPGIEDLEQRIAPATLRYTAPLGSEFIATLKSIGPNVILVDASENLLVSMASSDVSDVKITGSNGISTLTIDESTNLEFPIHFDSANGADGSNYTLAFLGNASKSATLTPSASSSIPNIIQYGENPVYYGGQFKLIAENLLSLTYVSPGRGDHLRIESPETGYSVISGTSDSQTLSSVKISQVGELIVDQTTNSAEGYGTQIQVGSSGLLAENLSKMKILTGVGSSTVRFENSSLSLPVSGRGIEVIGGTGQSTILGPDAINSWKLSGADAGQLTTSTSNATVSFSNIATLIGGSGTDTFSVGSSSNFDGWLNGGGGSDFYQIELSKWTGEVTVEDTGASGTDTLSVTSMSMDDVLTKHPGSVSSLYYSSVNHSGIEQLTTSNVLNLETQIRRILQEFQDGMRIGNYTFTPGNMQVGAFLGLVNPRIEFSNIIDPLGATPSGTVSILADSGDFFRGNQISAEVGRGSSANAINGTYNLSTHTYSFGIAELKITSKVLEATISNAQISYDPAGAENQELVRVSNLSAKLPQFDNVSVIINELSLRGNGFSLANASVTISTASMLLGAVQISSPTLSFENINYETASNIESEAFTGSIIISASAAVLFNGRKFSGTILPNAPGQPALIGNFNMKTGRISLNAGRLDLNSTGFFTASTSNITMEFDPQVSGQQTIVTIATLGLTIQPLRNTSVTVSNLKIRSDGFSFDNLTTVLGNISLGGYLSIDNPTVNFTGMNFTQPSNGSAAIFKGSLTLASSAATLFSGKSFSALITPMASGLPAISGNFNLNSGAFSINTGKTDLISEKLFSATTSNLTLGFDPSITSTQTLVNIGSLIISLKPLNDIGVTVSNLAIRNDGFSFDDLSLSTGNITIKGIIELVNPAIGLTDVNFTQSMDGLTSQFTGSISTRADYAYLFRGKIFSAVISPISFGLPAITGIFNLNLGRFDFNIGRLDLNCDGFFSAFATNISLGFDPSLDISQMLGTIGSISLNIKPLRDFRVDISNLRIRTDGFSFDDINFNLPDISFGNYLKIPMPTISLVGINLDDLSFNPKFLGSFNFSSLSGLLFPDLSFSGTFLPPSIGLPALTGVFDLNLGSFSLSAGALDFGIPDLFKGFATNIHLDFDPSLTIPQTLISIGTVGLRFKPFNNLLINIGDFDIRTNGFSFGDLTIKPGNLTLGGFLNLPDPTISFDDIDYSVSLDGLSTSFNGNLTFSSTSASLFPGKSFSATVTPATIGHPAISGFFNLNSGRFLLTAGRMSLTSDKLFTATANNLQFSFDPIATGTQTITSLGSLDLMIKPLDDASITVSNLAIRNDGFSFANLSVSPGNMSLGSILTVENPTIGMTGVNFVQPLDGSSSSFSGSLTMSANAATLFRGKSFSALISPSLSGQPGLSGIYNLNTQSSLCIRE